MTFLHMLRSLPRRLTAMLMLNVDSVLALQETEHRFFHILSTAPFTVSKRSSRGGQNLVPHFPGLDIRIENVVRIMHLRSLR
jgi:hypothetical protein